MFNDKIPTLTVDFAAKARKICRLYALLYRMYQPRAMCCRYNFPGANDRAGFSFHSLMEHSFLVAKITPASYAEFRDLFQETDIPFHELMFYGNIHDDPEAISGDASPVDGVAKAAKAAIEASAVQQLYGDLAIYEFMQAKFHQYEKRDEYAAKIVKMHDLLELVLSSQLWVRNGIGFLKQVNNPLRFCLAVGKEERPIDQRTYGEVAAYFDEHGVVKVEHAVFQSDDLYLLPVSRLMYDHSLIWLQASSIAKTAPELITLFQLISAEAFKFPFEDYSLANMPPIFAP